MLIGIKWLTLSKSTNHVSRWTSLTVYHTKDILFGTHPLGLCCCLPFILAFLGICIIGTLLPFLAPAALLLKVRQVSFISTVYFRQWTLVQWFDFFGFVNNVVGLTASEEIEIKSVQRILYMNPDLVEEQRETKDKTEDKARKSVTHLIAHYTRERVGVFAAFIMMNTWRADPDLHIALLRQASPVTGNQPDQDSKLSEETMMEEIVTKKDAAGDGLVAGTD